jgi:predicted HTH transcriptional regulator
MRTRHDHKDVEHWIFQGEGAELDFKQTIPSPVKIAKTMVAFANNRGGRIVVGVSDSGYIHGIDPEEEMYVLDEAGMHYCEPVILPEYIVHEYEGVSVLEARIPTSHLKPFKALDDDNTWKVYIRSGDKSMLASKTVIQQIRNDDGALIDRSLDSKETALLAHLKDNTFVTPKEFARKMNISEVRSRKIMINMAQEGYLLYHRDERGEYFSLK